MTSGTTPSRTAGRGRQRSAVLRRKRSATPSATSEAALAEHQRDDHGQLDRRRGRRALVVEGQPYRQRGRAALEARRQSIDGRQRFAGERPDPHPSMLIASPERSPCSATRHGPAGTGPRKRVPSRLVTIRRPPADVGDQRGPRRVGEAGRCRGQQEPVRGRGRGARVVAGEAGVEDERTLGGQSERGRLRCLARDRRPGHDRPVDGDREEGQEPGAEDRDGPAHRGHDDRPRPSGGAGRRGPVAVADVAGGHPVHHRGVLRRRRDHLMLSPGPGPGAVAESNVATLNVILGTRASSGPGAMAERTVR